MRSIHRHFTRAFTLLFLVLIAFSLSSLQHPPCFGGSDEAFSAIENAEDTLGQAFVAVLEVERAGANISVFAVRLNEAGELLAEAEMAYRNSDWNKALLKANECIAVANEVFANALEIKNSALQAAQKRFSHTLMFSFASSMVFVVSLILVWIYFKRYYLRRLLNMKPEEASDFES